MKYQTSTPTKDEVVKLQQSLEKDVQKLNNEDLINKLPSCKSNSENFLTRTAANINLEPVTTPPKSTKPPRPINDITRKTSSSTRPSKPVTETKKDTTEKIQSRANLVTGTVNFVLNNGAPTTKSLPRRPMSHDLEEVKKEVLVRRANSATKFRKEISLLRQEEK
jgi:hypothetical protein